MKPSLSALTRLAALATCLLVATAASAQTPAAKPATKPAGKSTKPAVKAPAKKVAPPVEAPLPVAEGEQLAAAAMTHFGDYACEFDQAVSVNVTPKNDGYVDVRFKNQTWTMKPVLSSTGALRLEDVKGRMLMLQIANKSMLMDAKIGQRLVDACVHEKQRLAIAAAASLPAGEPLLQGGMAAAAAAAAASAASAAASAASAAASAATTAAASASEAASAAAAASSSAASASAAQAAAAAAPASAPR